MSKLDRTIETLTQLRRQVCAYDYPGLKQPPATCDCKYATPEKPLSHNEATGCCEIRDAIDALKVIRALYDGGFMVMEVGAEFGFGRRLSRDR